MKISEIPNRAIMAIAVMLVITGVFAWLAQGRNIPSASLTRSLMMGILGVVIGCVIVIVKSFTGGKEK